MVQQDFTQSHESSTLYSTATRAWEPGGTYLKVEDDGPDEPEGQLGVAVDDVLAADIDELDLLVAQEPQRRLHVLDGVEAHAAALSGLRWKENHYLEYICRDSTKQIEVGYNFPSIQWQVRPYTCI